MPQPRKLHDKFFRQAKAEGYLARSAYKLKEIDERHRLLRPGDRVLDLGCAPGSWLQVASELVGATGVVVGIDLLETNPAAATWGESVGGGKVLPELGDAFAADPRHLLGHIRNDLNPGRLFDVVLSDMAPNTSGHGDDLLSARLCRRVLELLPAVLRPGGHMTMKIFEGAEYPAVIRETQGMFAKAKGFKPHACRDVSRETYIVAQGFRASGREVVKPPSRSGPPAPKAGW
jgi:23S rRNA (uridine2552-2'-O)-methyltransferase